MQTEKTKAPDFTGMDFNSLFQDEVIETKEEKKEEEQEKQEKTPEQVTGQTDETTSNAENEDNENSQGNDGEDGDEGGESEVSLFQQLNEDFGLELEGEFNEDYEGIKGYVQKAGSEIAARQLNELFERFPVAAEFIDYLATGGKAENFFESSIPDLGNLEIAEDNESMQEKIVRMKLRDDGLEDADINERIEAYKSAALLHNESQAALKILKKRKESEIAESQRAQEEQRQREEQEYREFVESTQSVIKKGELANVRIPEKEKKSFLEFIFKPVDKTGRTQREVVREKLTLEQRLELEYLVYKGLNVADIITAKKQTQNLAHLRKNAEKEASANQRKGATVNKPKPALPEGYSLKDLGL